MAAMSTSIAVCFAAICLSPVEDVVVDQVDLVEINHFYDDQGRLVFDQVIYYDWSPQHSRYQVRDWRLLKSTPQIPRRDWREGDFVSEWHDFKQKDVLRRVHAKAVRESWTQYDPELIEREFLPQEQRRELRKVVVGQPRSTPTLATSRPPADGSNSSGYNTPRTPR